MEKYMKIALKEAEKALKKGDVPVGAVIIYKEKVIAKAYNKKQNKQIATLHAEIKVIEKACKRLKTWHLEDCELYVTMEPCVMCAGAIAQSRIKKIIFGVYNEKYGFTKFLKNEYQKTVFGNDFCYAEGILKEEVEKMLKDFFKQKRK